MAERLCRVTHPDGYRCGLPEGHDGVKHVRRVEHHCHAKGCGAPIKPELLMCFRHWRMVPIKLQRAVWAAYRDGQCLDKNPSEAWHAAADAAIAHVADMEAKRRMLSPGVSP